MFRVVSPATMGIGGSRKFAMSAVGAGAVAAHVAAGRWRRRCAKAGSGVKYSSTRGGAAQVTFCVLASARPALCYVWWETVAMCIGSKSFSRRRNARKRRSVTMDIHVDNYTRAKLYELRQDCVPKDHWSDKFLISKGTSNGRGGQVFCATERRSQQGKIRPKQNPSTEVCHTRQHGHNVRIGGSHGPRSDGKATVFPLWFARSVGWSAVSDSNGCERWVDTARQADSLWFGMDVGGGIWQRARPRSDV